MATKSWVDISSTNGFPLDGNKPLPEPMGAVPGHSFEKNNKK